MFLFTGRILQNIVPRMRSCGFEERTSRRCWWRRLRNHRPSRRHETRPPRDGDRAEVAPRVLPRAGTFRIAQIWTSRRTPHRPRDGALGHVDAQLDQLAIDSEASHRRLAEPFA